MNLSIIIPHLKGKTILNECIQSIYDTLDSIEYELIIVNNNCQDNSIEYIAKKFSQCKIIDSNINLASTYVPDPGSSSETLFPFKSFTELILLFLSATKCICS